MTLILKSVTVLWLTIFNVVNADEHSISTADLLKRIEVLEGKGKKLELHMVDQERRHHIQLENLKKVVAKQSSRIKSLEDELAKFEDTVAKHTSEAVKTGQRHGIVRRNADADVSNGLKHQRLVLGIEGPVAFHAEITHSNVSHIGIGQKIVFDSTFLNIGGGYNNKNGLFIAPEAGIYIFSTSVMSYYKPHNEIWVSLRKNGNRLGGAFAYGDASRDQGSITVVTQLAVGDEVWVSLGGLADDSLWGHGFTSFMGCLVMYV